jgi:hypothetical protein
LHEKTEFSHATIPFLGRVQYTKPSGIVGICGGEEHELWDQTINCSLDLQPFSCMTLTKVI